MFHHAAWYKKTDVSEVLTALITETVCAYEMLINIPEDSHFQHQAE
jgi:hypothetical protein